MDSGNHGYTAMRCGTKPRYLHTEKSALMKDLIVKLGFLEFPPAHTCDGGDLSPQITLAGLDAGAVAIMAVNPYHEPKCCTFSPWVIWNIDPVPVVPAGIPKERLVTSPVRAVQGTNDLGAIGYSGPCPPRGSTIRYMFKVWGLDAPLDLPPGSDKHALVQAMRGHVVQFGDTVAICTR